MKITFGKLNKKRYNKINIEEGKNEKKLIIIIGFLMAFATFVFVNITLEKVSMKNATWASGKVKILNKEITLPCNISEFEEKYNVTISKENINFSIADVTLYSSYGNLNLK